MDDSCHKLLPAQANAGLFDCSFVVDNEGKVVGGGLGVGVVLKTGGVYSEKAETLPNLPLMLFMRAAGFTTVVILPMLLIFFMGVRNSLRAPAVDSDNTQSLMASQHEPA